MRMQFVTSLEDEVAALIEGHVAEHEGRLTEIIESAIQDVLDDDTWQQLDEMPERAIENETFNAGFDLAEIGVAWTVDLEALADWSGVSLDVLQEALAAEVEGIAPVGA